MRISDWSSDVCSSDLLHDLHPRRRGWIADLRRPVMRLVRVLVGSVFAALFVGGITAWIFSSHDGRADADATAQVALSKPVYVANCASCPGADLEGQPNWRQHKADGRLPAPPKRKSVGQGRGVPVSVE